MFPAEEYSLNRFDRFRPLDAARAELATGGTMPVGAVTEQILSASEGVIGGTRVIPAGSINYLGLSSDQTCIAAARQALEQELAQLFGTPRAIVFSTGFPATMGMVSTLVRPNDPLLLDADCQASIYEAARLSAADSPEQVGRIRDAFFGTGRVPVPSLRRLR
jgi:8-amino-7-oxononanoate synthase